MALGPSVLSVVFAPVDLTPDLVWAIRLEVSLAVADDLLAVLPEAPEELSLDTFCVISCFFLSATAFLFSDMASALSLSFRRFSSIFFFLSASCCSLSLVDLSIFSIVPLDFLMEPAALPATGLLAACLVVDGLPEADAGFFAPVHVGNREG